MSQSQAGCILADRRMVQELEQVEKITSLFLDKDQKIWAGTQDAGIVLLHPADSSQSILNENNGLRQQIPDLLFLDITLGDGTGFDLLAIFPDLKAKVIFITASDEYALRAFRYAAVDYLLKPVDAA